MPDFPKNIAIVRTDKLGDMVLTLPMCLAIKKHLPDVKITVIANSYVEALLDRNPHIDNLFYIDKIRNGIKSIFKENIFDAAFFPRPRFDECFQAFINKVPLRIGTAYRWYSFLFNEKITEHRKKGNLHEAQYNVNLINKVYGLSEQPELVSPYISEEADKYIKDALKAYELDDFIIIHPGSGGSANDLPIKKIAELAKLLTEEHNFKVVLTGAKNERQICDEIMQHAPQCTNLSGILNLRQLFALINQSALLIANSTGVLHIAAALKTPVVGLYPNTSHLSARRWGPLSDNSIVITPPLSYGKRHQDDMNLIAPTKIVEACKKILQT